MSASTGQAVSEQRDVLVDKVEQAVTHKAVLGNQGLILHFRVLLQDLPFAGIPSLLLDEHRDAIDKLVERASTDDIKIFAITGHTSEPGTDALNQQLSLDRAEAVFAYLQQAVDAHPGFSDNSLYAGIRRDGFGENQLAAATPEGADNPLNRRVEIRYRIKIIFPQPPGGVVPRSRYWKIDFAAGGGVGSKSIGVESGLGTLKMLPDGENDQFQTIQKSLTYKSLGVSVGLLSVLKKLKFVAKFPKVKKSLEALDSDLPGNYKRTEDFLKNAGFSVDVVSQGGEFETSEPLSFAEMANFNFSTVSGNISLGASGSGSLVLLHSGYFFASTVIYGGGLNIAFPDVALNFVPAAWVQVQTGT